MKTQRLREDYAKSDERVDDYGEMGLDKVSCDKEPTEVGIIGSERVRQSSQVE